MNQKIGFFKELKRRNVFKVAIAYIVMAWLLAQVADLVLDNFGAPEGTMKVLLIALAIGFPVSLAISWAFEVTTKGVVLESRIDRTLSITDQSGKRIDRTIIAILAIVIIFMGLERFVFSGHDAPITIMGPDTISQSQSTTPLNSADQKLYPAPLNPLSVAVLPFAVTSTGPDDDYFADGLTEEIINALSQLPELMVTARTSAFYFKGQNIPIGEIAGQLGVANLVEGSVRRAGEQLRITAQLVRASDGFHLWSETYDRRTEDTFAVQQDIAEKVATALNVLLDENQRVRMQQAGLKNVEAFIANQKATELFNKAHTDTIDISLLRQGNHIFDTVIELVPDFSDAYIHRADLFTHVLMAHASGQLDGNITEADLESAPAALRFDLSQAVNTAQDKGERLIAEADRALTLGEWRGLAALTERALSAPGCHVAYWAQLTSAPFGKARLLQDGFKGNVVCDPLEIRTWVHIANAYLWLGQPQQAQQVAEQTPVVMADHHMLVRTLAMALASQGEFEAAERVANDRLKSASERFYTLATVAALRGDSEQSSTYQNEFLGVNGPDDQASLVMEASRGNRFEANRLASLIDSRSFGYMALMHAVYDCTCGAPFDLDYTPVFASLLQDSGLQWPPLSPIDFPLKDW